MSNKFITNGVWEKIGSNTPTSDRLKVPGGWIIRTFIQRGSYAGGSIHQIFIKDENYTWIIEKE
jgi:hypothetical protein